MKTGLSTSHTNPSAHLNSNTLFVKKRSPGCKLPIAWATWLLRKTLQVVLFCAALQADAFNIVPEIPTCMYQMNHPEFISGTGIGGNCIAPPVTEADCSFLVTQAVQLPGGGYELCVQANDQTANQSWQVTMFGMTPASGSGANPCWTFTDGIPSFIITHYVQDGSILDSCQVDLEERSTNPPTKEKTFSELVVIPNPASDMVRIQLGERQVTEVPLKVQVLTLSGQIMYTGELFPNSRELSLLVEDWPGGIYFVRVSGSTGPLSRTFVIQHN